MKLNAKQRLFVKEYLKDQNAARAYRSVYGAKPSVAETIGPRLLRKAQVTQAVEKGLAKLEQKIEYSAERTLARLAEFAYQPLTVKELKGFAGHNAIRANELLAKHFKLLTDVHEHSVPAGIQVNLSMPANDSEAKKEEGNGPSS